MRSRDEGGGKLLLMHYFRRQKTIFIVMYIAKFLQRFEN